MPTHVTSIYILTISCHIISIALYSSTKVGSKGYSFWCFNSKPLLNFWRQYLWKGNNQNHPNENYKKKTISGRDWEKCCALQWQRQIADCFSSPTISWSHAQTLLQFVQIYVTIGTNTFYMSKTNSWLFFLTHYFMVSCSYSVAICNLDKYILQLGKIFLQLGKIHFTCQRQIADCFSCHAISRYTISLKYMNRCYRPRPKNQ